jgi:hypothetical protein
VLPRQQPEAAVDAEGVAAVRRLRQPQQADAEAVEAILAAPRIIRRSIAPASAMNKGGTLVALGGASEFAIEQFSLGLRNSLASLSTKDFWCPGSTLRLDIDNTQPAAYGMPGRAFGVFLQGNMAFDLSNTANENYHVIARYADREILQSGWLVGEQNLSKKAAMVTAGVGKGRVIVVGFRAQHRAQTYGTFKLLFNSLIG